MRLPLMLAIVLATACPCLAEPDTSIAGTWVLWNPRTVIGTGQIDIVLKITGRAKTYHLSHTSGAITRVRTTEGRFIFKTTTTTFSRVPLKPKGDLYFFSLPGKSEPTYLKPARVGDKKALIVTGEDGRDAGGGGRPFLRRADEEDDGA
ncbi:MAG: hypothetical protein OER86_06120 [Phycisphaerae bacterium]|nr:hypothetical protein [Phycisphaerae bacterium]